MTTPLAYTIAEACEVSGVGRTTIYKAIKTGKLIARKSGRRTIILADDLAAWLRSLPKLNTDGLCRDPAGVPRTTPLDVNAHDPEAGDLSAPLDPGQADHGVAPPNTTQAANVQSRAKVRGRPLAQSGSKRRVTKSTSKPMASVGNINKELMRRKQTLARQAPTSTNPDDAEGA
jgi:excisionase family DNA binding protein